MTVTAAYAARAQEYAELLGSLEAMAPADRRRIESWADGADGPLLDLGCGPGHWTAHLASLGYDVHGVDPVEEFVAIARRRHPEVRYHLGALEGLRRRRDSYGGILAWYSLIHLPPAEVPGALAVLHGALRPTGTLLLGFFDGPRREEFDHAVAPARFWPAGEMATLLEQVGFARLEVKQRQDPGARPHAAIAARRR